MARLLCYIIFMILILITENLCSNITNLYYNKMGFEQFQTRSNRLLSFNTQDQGDIVMELDFNVPFITIPVKKSMDMANGAIANLNVGALILGGAVAFGFAVVIPAITLFLSKKMFSGSSYNGYRREESQNWWEFLNVMDQALTENDIDTTSCMQRFVCMAVKNSAQNVIHGQSTSSDKIIDGLATNKWLQNLVEGTVIHYALYDGLNNADCMKKYSQCKISQTTIEMFTKQFVDTINKRK